MKPCSMCGVVKSLDDFHKLSKAKDGRQQRCKECAKAVTQDWYARNRDERLRKLRERNAANPEPNRDRARRWYEQNKDRALEKSRAYKKANPEKVREWELHRLIRNAGKKRPSTYVSTPERRAKDRMRQRRRAATLASVPTYLISQRDMRRLLASPCTISGCTNTDMHIDHIIPISRGGSHGIGNLQALCAFHNFSKNARTWMEFRMHLAALAKVQQSISA